MLYQWSMVDRIQKYLYSIKRWKNAYEERILSAASPSDSILSNTFQPELDERPIINLDNIYITKETIDKIYTHAISGKSLPYMEDSLNSDENDDTKSISPQKRNYLILLDF